METKITGMMRVRDCARWIGDSVQSLLKVCQYVMVLDDHSSDKTVEILNCFGVGLGVNGHNSGVKVKYSPFQGLDEQRDKNYLLGLTLSYFPYTNWIVHVDGDEVLEKAAPEIIKQELETCPPESMIQAYNFRIDHLWNTPETHRVDGRYGTWWRGSMFRVKGLDRGFRSTDHGNGANLHCTNLPAGIVRTKTMPVRVKHYGYMDPIDRVRKWRYFSQIDPGGKQKYLDLVIGDLADVPADTVTQMAGPLVLAPWREEDRLR